MRSHQQFLDEYAVSHQNPVNQVIHMICVPAIFFATLGMMWMVPVGKFLPGLSPEVGHYINLATLFLIPSFFFYARLSFAAVAIGALWAVASLALILGIEAAGLPVGWLCLAVWVTAWAGQFYGHKVEGAKPSFADDLLFLLIGPLFVQQKFNRLLSTGASRPQAH